MKNKHFVIDTNNLLSAFLFEYSTPTLAYNKAKKLGKISKSIETFDELSEVLVRSKFDKYVSLEKRLKLINDFKEILILFTVSEKITD